MQKLSLPLEFYPILQPAGYIWPQLTLGPPSGVTQASLTMQALNPHFAHCSGLCELHACPQARDGPHTGAAWDGRRPNAWLLQQAAQPVALDGASPEPSVARCSGASAGHTCPRERSSRDALRDGGRPNAGLASSADGPASCPRGCPGRGWPHRLAACSAKEPHPGTLRSCFSQCQQASLWEDICLPCCWGNCFRRKHNHIAFVVHLSGFCGGHSRQGPPASSVRVPGIPWSRHLKILGTA